MSNTRGLSITLDSVADTRLRYDPNANAFGLEFMGRADERVTVTLTPEALQTLALQCIARLPELAAPVRVATDLDAVRRPARMIQRYDDRSIQILLRELDADTILAFLWFMKDAALLKQVIRNFSRRAAEMLMDDLQQDWSGRDPDDPEQSLTTRKGIAAVAAVLETCRRLTDEGQLPEVVTRPSPLPEESSPP